MPTPYVIARKTRGPRLEDLRGAERTFVRAGGAGDGAVSDRAGLFGDQRVLITATGFAMTALRIFL